MSTTLPLDGITDRDFTLTIERSAGGLQLGLAGTADVRVVEPLAAFLPKLHELVVRESLSRVTVDFTALEFMNSACFKSLVSWIGAIQSDAHKYAIEFRANAAPWQRRSLEALRCFAPDLITVHRPQG